MMINHFECTSIRNLEELDIESQNSFDVVITDLLFEGVAPRDFVFHIGEVILHSSLIIITSMGQAEVEQEIFEQKEVRGFFSVPLDFAQIEKLVA
ncbi:hypothetical protein GCM10010465_22040 [Actinomadura fibrosa]